MAKPKLTKHGKPAKNSSDNREVYDLMYSRDLPLDDGVNLPVLDSRPLHSIVSSSTLPTYTEYDFNPKKGKFTERQVRAKADETILSSARSAQGRLGHHMVTGSQPKVNQGSKGMCSPCPPMSTKRGY